jgi:hypothetical protein
MTWTRSYKWFGGVCLVLGVAGSCGGTTGGPTNGSESHFLDSCGAAGCPDGLSCLCGVCTRRCGSAEECTPLSAGARCVELDDIPSAKDCESLSLTESVCDQPCSANAACAVLGASFDCVQGVCREGEPEPEPEPERDPACDLPIESGSCLAAMPRFGFNPSSGKCQEFTYGGCQGNANNFATRSECEETCDVWPSETFACTWDQDCVAVDPKICGCDPRYLYEYTAVNRNHHGEYTEPLQPVACAPCPPVENEQRHSVNFGARCVSGRCEMYDVRDSEFAECTLEVGCKLRYGLGCCENCASTAPPVAIRSDVDFFTAIDCSSAPILCVAPCEQGPVDLAANPECVNGRCTVVWDEQP